MGKHAPRSPWRRSALASSPRNFFGDLCATFVPIAIHSRPPKEHRVVDIRHFGASSYNTFLECKVVQVENADTSRLECPDICKNPIPKSIVRMSKHNEFTFDLVKKFEYHNVVFESSVFLTFLK